MTATAEHVRCLCLEGCQDGPQAERFLVASPRGPVRATHITHTHSVIQMFFGIVPVVKRARKEEPTSKEVFGTYTFRRTDELTPRAWLRAYVARGRAESGPPIRRS